MLKYKYKQKDSFYLHGVYILMGEDGTEEDEKVGEGRGKDSTGGVWERNYKVSGMDPEEKLSHGLSRQLSLCGGSVRTRLQD